MPTYEIYFRCDDCNQGHPNHLRIYLEDGPEHKETLAAYLCGYSMPPQATTIQGRKAFCLRTGRRFKLESEDQMFLVPFTKQHHETLPTLCVKDHRQGSMEPDDYLATLARATS